MENRNIQRQDMEGLHSDGARQWKMYNITENKYNTTVMVFDVYIWIHIIIAVLPEPPGLILPHVAPTLGFFFILSISSCRASGEKSTSPSSAMTYVFSAYIVRHIQIIKNLKTKDRYTCTFDISLRANTI
jgi:hypothetical protein